MLFTIIKDPVGQYLEIQHGSDKLDFDVGSLLSKNNNIETMFFTLNKFLDTLPMSKLQALFDVYSEFYIYKNRNIDYSAQEVSRYLESILALITSIITLEDIKPWMQWHQTDIVLPSNLEDVFTYDPDMNVTEDKTYIKSQYLDLISTLQIVKLCLPVLGEFNNYTKEVSKQSLHKTFLLLVNSSIYESQEMTKLRVYINQIQQTTKSQASSKHEQYIVNKGICSDDIVDNIVSEIFLNKLLNADLYSLRSNIISIVFQTIKIKTNPSVADSDIIRMKKEPGLGEDSSFFEDYRVTTDIPIGTVSEMQFALDRTNNIVRHLKVEQFFDPVFYEHELKFSKDLLDQSLDETQIYLLGWFLGRYIDPRSLFYIESKKVVELLTLVRVVTWNQGHKFISLLLTSCKSRSDTVVMNLGSKTSISKEVQDKLKQKYNFFYTTEDHDNEIEKSLLAIQDKILSKTWHTNANLDHVLEHNKDSRKGNRKLSIPINIGDSVALYLLSTL